MAHLTCQQTRRCTTLLKALSLALSLHATVATSWYVSAAGNDSAAGTSPATAWATLARVSAASIDHIIKAGDSVYFHCGDEFFGSLGDIVSGASPLQPTLYSAYCEGTGAAPVLTGGWAIPDTAWTSCVLPGQPQAYCVTLPAEALKYGNVSDVFIAGTRAPPAATPWMELNNATKLWLQSSQLAGAPVGAWVGATVRVRCGNYVYDTALVTASDASGNLTLATPLFAAPTPGAGFFLTGPLSTLLTPTAPAASWYVDSSGVLHVSGTAPPTTVVATVVPVAAPMGNGGIDVSFSGLTFTHYSSSAIFSYTASQVSITNCIFDQISGTAVNLEARAQGITFTENSLSQCGAGVFLALNGTVGAPPSLILNNTLTDMGMLPGCGTTGINGASGIVLWSGRGALIANNTLARVGYAAIRFDCNDHTVTNNFISDAMMTLNDGGALYTYGTTCGGHIITNNIVLRSVGNGSTNAGAGSIGAGVYLDGFSSNVLVHGNALIDCGGTGIVLNGGSGHTITNNTVVGFGGGGVGAYEYSPGAVHNLTLSGNVFARPALPDACYGGTPNAILTLQYTASSTDPLPDFFGGGASDNVFYNPYGPLVVDAYFQYDNTHHVFTLSQWQRATAREARSLVAVNSTLPIAGQLGENALNNPFFNASSDGTPSAVGWGSNGGASAVAVNASAPGAPSGCVPACLSIEAPGGGTVSNTVMLPSSAAGSTWVLRATLAGPAPGDHTFVAGINGSETLLYMPIVTDAGLLDFSGLLVVPPPGPSGSVALSLQLPQSMAGAYLRDMTLQPVLSATPAPVAFVALVNPSAFPSAVPLPGGSVLFFDPTSSPTFTCFPPDESLQLPAWGSALIAVDLWGHCGA